MCKIVMHSNLVSDEYIARCLDDHVSIPLRFLKRNASNFEPYLEPQKSLVPWLSPDADGTSVGLC